MLLSGSWRIHIVWPLWCVSVAKSFGSWYNLLSEVCIRLFLFFGQDNLSRGNMGAVKVLQGLYPEPGRLQFIYADLGDPAAVSWNKNDSTEREREREHYSMLMFCLAFKYRFVFQTLTNTISGRQIVFWECIWCCNAFCSCCICWWKYTRTSQVKFCRFL